jgi:hypothetical protein
MPNPANVVGLVPLSTLPLELTVTDLYVPAVTPVSDKVVVIALVPEPVTSPLNTIV